MQSEKVSGLPYVAFISAGLTVGETATWFFEPVEHIQRALDRERERLGLEEGEKLIPRRPLDAPCPYQDPGEVPMTLDEIVAVTREDIQRIRRMTA